VRLEEFGKLKKKISNLIGNGTCDLPACSIAPQTTTLPSVLAGRLVRLSCQASHDHEDVSETAFTTQI
jgi:hypothetical protein